MDTRDRYGRSLADLRISVTDRCNFRCVYCMPREVFGDAYVFAPRESLLTFEEIARLAGAFVDLGVRKIRLTGGEPLMRRDLERLVAMLARLGVDDLALTTNGSLLTRAKARALREAGLRRVTISLDSLDEAVFRRMVDAEIPLERVLEAIDAANDEGLAPVKIDVVVKRGANDGEVLAIAERFRHTPNIVRFIEYMDVGTTNGWRLADVVTAAEILETIRSRWAIEPLDATYSGEVAQRWRYVDGGGELGVISSVSQPFCRSCTRARISAEGELFTCLFATRGTDLRKLLREGATNDVLIEAIRAAWTVRDDRYSEIRSEETRLTPKVEMSYIGG